MAGKNYETLSDRTILNTFRVYSLYELIQDIDGSDCFSKLDTNQYPWGWGWEKANLYSSVGKQNLHNF